MSPYLEVWGGAQAVGERCMRRVLYTIGWWWGSAVRWWWVRDLVVDKIGTVSRTLGRILYVGVLLRWVVACWGGSGTRRSGADFGGGMLLIFCGARKLLKES